MRNIYVLIVFLVFLTGCMSVPEKDLSSDSGVIAAHMGVEKKVVDNIQSKGYDREDTVKILIISESSYLTPKEIEEKISKGQNIEDIAEETGIGVERLNKETEKINKSINSY